MGIVSTYCGTAVSSSCYLELHSYIASVPGSPSFHTIGMHTTTRVMHVYIFMEKGGESGMSPAQSSVFVHVLKSWQLLFARKNSVQFSLYICTIQNSLSFTTLECMLQYTKQAQYYGMWVVYPTENSMHVFP